MLKTGLFNKLVAAAILLHSFFLSYFLLFLQYFQQDEWHGFGIILSQGIRYITVDKSILELLLGDRVGARIVTFGLFNLFHLNPVPYGVVALVFHLSNTLLVFLLARKLTNKFSIGILSGLFFLVSELGNESYSWFGTMNGSATSVLFFLVSLYFFLRFIDTKKSKFVIISAFLLWVSFLFKEIAAFAFILYPIIFFLYSPINKKGVTWFVKKYFPFIIIAAIMLTYFTKTALFIPGDQANYVSTKDSFLSKLITHSIQYPLEGTVQTFIPNSILFSISPLTTKIAQANIPTDSLEFLILSQDKYAEITTILILIGGAVLGTFLMKKNWKAIPISNKRALILSMLMTVLSFTPYVVLNRSFSYLDSRHYYMATVSASIFLGTFLLTFFSLSKSTKIKTLIVIIGFGYILMHEMVLIDDFKLLAQRSKERQSFLKQTENLVPNLSQKTVFYITGDSQGYYGLPELKVPLQSGPGHVLMVLYTTKKQLNPAFFNEATFTKVIDIGFLYDILGQGYREINGQGFGYYYDPKEIRKALGEKLFSDEDIIYLYYEQENKKLVRKDSI